MLWMNYNSLHHSTPDLRVSTPVKKKPPTNASVLKGLLFHCHCSSPSHRRQNTTRWYFKSAFISTTKHNSRSGMGKTLGTIVEVPSGFVTTCGQSWK
ncbi:hypothetical protein J6590_051799 [Homalodisca vitripennis]|nr:hypothetical protein J6590_051799 [Homalodisca vitripennis]